MTSFTGRTIPTTTLSGRTPVGRGYLLKEDGGYLLTEDGGRFIIVDSEDTIYEGRQQITSPGGFFKISADSFFKINTTDKLKTQVDYDGTLYTGRIIP